MKRELFLSIAAVFLILVGLGFFFLTSVVLTQFLVDQSGSATLLNLEKNLGIFVFAIGLVNLGARKSADAIALRAIMLGTFVALVASGALDAYSVAAGLYTQLGWGVVVVKALFAGGYAYYFFKAGRPT